MLNGRFKTLRERAEVHLVFDIAYFLSAMPMRRLLEFEITELAFPIRTLVLNSARYTDLA